MYSPQTNFLFFPYHNSGAHFVNWSLSFLQGENYYFSQDNNYSRLMLAQDFDLNLSNFHQHQCKKLYGSADLENFLAQDHNNVYTLHKNIYLMGMHPSTAVHMLFGKDINESSNFELITALDYILQDASSAISRIQNQNSSLIFVKYSKFDILNCFYNDRCPISVTTNQPVTRAHAIDEYKNLFHANIDHYFDSNIWDSREKLALMIQPFDSIDFESTINQQKKHLMYHTDDIWNDLPAVIREIVEFTGAKLNPSRWNAWLAIYNIWRLRHDPFFSRNFDNIISAIVHNRYMSLTRYNLDFYKEALIQHALIYQHNLNLKTWGLEKFPANTQDLYALLEPNIHPV